MKTNFSTGVRIALVCSTFVLTACAGYGGSNLKPGVSTLPEVIASMGQPAMIWKSPDGGEQLAYPRGPAATQTFMAYVGPDGTLQRIDKVLEMSVFAKIQAGMSQDAVQRLIGPPQPHWTQYFKARDELVWSWLFCDSWSRQAFFDVLFDGKSGLVRSTMQRPNYVGRDGVVPSCGQ